MKKLIAWLAKAFSSPFYFGPPLLRKSVAYVLAFLWFDLLRIRRQVVMQNLDLAFPEMPRSKKMGIARKSMQNLALNFVEYSFFPWLKKRDCERLLEFHGLEKLEAALAQKRGLLVLTLHMGNGDMAICGLSLIGYPLVLVSKFFKLKWLNEFWFGIRERLGTRFVAPRDSSYTLLKSLKQNRVVIFPLDQFTGPPIGGRTTFFGHETGTALGLAVMSQRSKVPVLSVFTLRTPDNRYAVYFENDLTPKADESPEQATQRFNDEIERLVRKHPEQWMWLHKRWKKFKY